MTSPVTVSISIKQITGTALPRARVTFERTAADIDGAIIAPAATTVTCEADRTGSASLMPNATGSQGTQTRVTVVNEHGELQFSGLATIPASSCNLHTIIELSAPAVQADVTTVAAIAADVSAVADIAANVTTVAGIAANVTTVAGIAANVTTVAGIAADVPTVADAAANVATVAGDIADVSTVAGSIADVTTAATNIAAIQAAPTEAAAAASSAIDAQTAQTNAEAARDAAAGYSGVTLKTTKALLDADLAHAADSIGRVTNDSTVGNNGDYIKIGASGSGSWSKISSTQIASALQQLEVVESGYIGSQLIGPGTPVSGTALGNQTYVMTVPVEADGYVRGVRAYGIAASTLDLRVFQDVGGTITYVRGVTLTLAAGSINMFLVPDMAVLEVTAGDYIGVYSATALARTTGLASGTSPTPYWAAAGNNTTSFAKPAETSSVRLELEVAVAKRYVALSDVAVDRSTLALFADEDTDTMTIGVASPATQASAASAVTYLLDYVINERGYISQIQVYAKAIGKIKFKLFEDVSGTMTWRQTVQRDVVVGLNTFDFPDELSEMVTAGNYYVAWYAPAGVVALQSVADNAATTKNYNTAGDNETTFTVGTANTTNEMQIKFTVVKHKTVSDRVADNQIHVGVTANASVKTYFYSGAGYWTEYEIEKATTTGTAAGGSFSGWRSKGMWKCKRNRAGKFFRVSPITARPTSSITSEIDQAVQTSGAADFVGGYVHGFDQMSAAAFVLDGEALDATTTASYVGQKLEFRQAGTLYMQGTDVTNSANKLADYVKYVNLADRQVDIGRESIQWLRSVTVSKDYVGMLPMSRGDATYGSMVDRISRPTGWTASDISAASGVQDAGAYSRRTVWGASTKLRANSEATSGFTDSTRTGHVEVNAGNAKVYFAFLSGVAVTNGLTHSSQNVRHKIVTGA